MIAMMKYPVIILLCLLSSCATSRNTDYNRDEQKSEKLDRLEQLITEIRTDIDKQYNSVTDKLSNMKMASTTVVLSPPDSTGRQHATQVTSTNMSREDSEKVTESETTAVRIDFLSQKIDSIAYLLNVALSEKEAVVELSWWDRYKVEVLLGVVIVLFAINYFRKKIP